MYLADCLDFWRFRISVSKHYKRLSEQVDSNQKSVKLGRAPLFN